METKVLQIGYEPERDRLTWDGWDIHCGQGLDVLLPDRLGGGTWRSVSFEYNAEGWYMPGCPGVSPVGLWARESKNGKKKVGVTIDAGFFLFSGFLHCYKNRYIVK